MKKFTQLAIILSLSIISIPALAIVSIVQNDQVPAKEIVYGSPSDTPFIRSSFKLYKGWNLIPSAGDGIAMPARTKSKFFGYPKEMGCGIKENDFSGYQVKYMYAHIPNKGYVGGKIDYNSNRFESSVQKEFENAARGFYQSTEMGGSNGIWSLFLTSNWVYSDMDCEYPLAQIEIRDIDNAQRQNNLKNMKLSKGWNLIFNIPAFYGEQIKDVIGDCNILKVNYWLPDIQKWQLSSTESQQGVSSFLNAKIDISDLYLPSVIKVENTCTLGQIITSPPELPD